MGREKTASFLSALIFCSFCAQGFAVQATTPAKNGSKPRAAQTQKSAEKSPPQKSALESPNLEVKLGYFMFTDSKMREVFDHGGIDVQLSTSYPVRRHLQIYASVEYQRKSGHSINGREETTFWAVPLSLGLKPVATFSSYAQGYFTIGPRYVFAHVHNDSHFVDRNVSHNGFGGFVNAGLNFFPLRHLLVDLFAEYSYVRMHFHPHKHNVYGESRQVGGLVFGAGLGYVF